ncbi:hypothetical protein MKEN_01019600 [Mycena kentingensis (nom. inval.)]|nr:hypothetical protein MKEN_01019600 [Mycena kentingensis (nom. inval.)]
MAMATTRNGRPEPEVIMNFTDGFSYAKGAMAEAFREIADKPPVLQHANPPLTKAQRELAKKEDVDIIVAEFEIPRAQAERLLVEHQGKLQDALRALLRTLVLSNLPQRLDDEAAIRALVPAGLLQDVTRAPRNRVAVLTFASPVAARIFYQLACFNPLRLSGSALNLDWDLDLENRVVEIRHVLNAGPFRQKSFRAMLEQNWAVASIRVYFGEQRVAIEFKHSSDARAALKRLQARYEPAGYVVCPGPNMGLPRYEGMCEKHAPNPNIYIRNLGAATEDGVRRELERFGELEWVRILPDWDCAFAHFADDAHAAIAAKAIHTEGTLRTLYGLPIVHGQQSMLTIKAQEGSEPIDEELVAEFGGEPVPAAVIPSYADAAVYSSSTPRPPTPAPTSASTS